MKKTLLVAIFAMFICGNLFSQTSLPLCFRNGDALNGCSLEICIDVLLDEGTLNARVARVCKVVAPNSIICFQDSDFGPPASFSTAKVLGSLLTVVATSTYSYVNFTNEGISGVYTGVGCAGNGTFRIDWDPINLRYQIYSLP